MNRSTTYRVHPRSPGKARMLAQTAGACRWAWNEILREILDEYEAGGSPPLTQFSLQQRFIHIRHRTPWLQELPCAPIRHTAKRMAEAWRSYFKGQRGKPRFKAKRGDDSVTVPHGFRIEDSRIWFPRIGWLRLSGSDLYIDCRPLQATFKQVCGKWYCSVVYEVPDEEPADNGHVLGVDRNVRQVATSDGDFHHVSDTERLEARKRRYQRRMARQVKGSNRRNRTRLKSARTSRKLANSRSNWAHQTSRELANVAGTVVFEKLNIPGMTRSAKGTVEKPGGNVRQKAGLNRSILHTAWGQLLRFTEYKAARTVQEDPAHSSQECSVCGHIDRRNRKSQSKFLCVSCGYSANADVNAAINIRNRYLASGTGAAGRREAFPPGTSETRQKVFGEQALLFA